MLRCFFFFTIIESENYITLQSGEIASPMYPKMYRGFQNDEVYSWTINVDEGKIIEIILKEFVCTTKLHSLKVKKKNIF